MFNFLVSQFAKCSSPSFQDLFPAKETGFSARTKVTFQTMREQFPVIHVHVVTSSSLLSTPKFDDNLGGVSLD